jgi:ankyrin repeat protein
MRVSQHSPPRNIIDLTDGNEPAYIRMESQSTSDKHVSINTEVTAPAVVPAGEDRDNDSDLDLTRFKHCILDGESLRGLFQMSRIGELSPLVLPMLHRASNNLLSLQETNLIVQGSDRRVLNALISTRSPATQAIARSLLPAAIESRDVELVRSLLNTGVSPDAPLDHTSRTALQFAVAEDDLDEGILDLVQLLLDYGAQVNLPCAEHTLSPLVYAAGQGHLGLVQLLLVAGADVNAHASAGQTTALQAAAGAYPVFRLWPSATGSDRVEMAQLLLSAGADVNAHPHSVMRGETALQIAVRHENITLVQVLLSNGAKANAPAASQYLYTALERAAYTGNLEIIDLLLTWGASDILSACEFALEQAHWLAAQALLSGAGLDDTDNEASQIMLLRAGVQSGDYHFVQGLLESMLDVGARHAPAIQDTRWMTVLPEAAMKGRIDLVELLMAFGADVNAPAAGKCGKTALRSAAQTGNIELVRFLLNAGADVDSQSSEGGMTALAAAASEQSPEIVRLLLDAGADTFEQGAAAIMAALESGCLESVHLIRDSIESSGVDGYLERFQWYADYDIDSELMSFLLEHDLLNDYDALAYAIAQQNIGLVKAVFDHKADVNAGQYYCRANQWVLELAVVFSDLEIIQLLLEHGADSQEKARALQVAAYQGCLEAVEVLIDAGADVNAAPTSYSNDLDQRERRTALQAAAQQGHLDVVRLLLEQGAEVERSSISEDEEGTALQFAAIAGSIVIANELIQRGANVNAAPLGENGRTALEGAAEHGRLDMVQLLLNLEAEVRGSRALQFARKEGHGGVVMLLLENGFQDDVQMSG